MNPNVFDTVLTGLDVDPGLRDAILGDLVEERSELAATRGERYADWWMLSQMLRSLPVLAHARLRAGGARELARTLGAACGALLIVIIVGSASATMAFRAFSSQTLAAFAVVLFAIDVGYGIAGGYLAARLRRVAPLAGAVAFGILALLLSAVAGGDSTPGWYSPALQLLILPATLAGGWLRARQLARTR